MKIEEVRFELLHLVRRVTMILPLPLPRIAASFFTRSTPAICSIHFLFLTCHFTHYLIKLNKRTKIHLHFPVFCMPTYIQLHCMVREGILAVIHILIVDRNWKTALTKLRNSQLKKEQSSFSKLWLWIVIISSLYIYWFWFSRETTDIPIPWIGVQLWIHVPRF